LAVPKSMARSLENTPKNESRKKLISPHYGTP
jgi:hypothetical protein